ncbi:hypothetical protein [Haloferula sp. A504]|uniref:hypothetical protein n=1 Tax=Haloferula sp. A504 TaxID=3373601 RepID=UPI0031C627BC|nr:hypothetical protein [Verrucomicrobiaceae bacterium E54]
MKLKHSLAGSLTAILLVGLLQGAEILDTRVPWSGNLRDYTMAELVARMTGWADLDPDGDFRFTERLPDDIGSKRIDLIRIAEDSRPTYRELLVSAFDEIQKTVEIRRGRSGIEVIYLYTRIYNLPYATKQELSRKGRLSLQGIQAELDEKGWQMSEFADVRFFPETSSILIRGTKEDVESAWRFFGLN